MKYVWKYFIAERLLICECTNELYITSQMVTCFQRFIYKCDKISRYFDGFIALRL